MNKNARVSHPIYGLLPASIEGFDALAKLALDMRWELTHNPWVVLQTVSRDKIERVLADATFRAEVEGLLRASHQADDAPAWFQKHHAQRDLTCVAYFSMEFMLSEALPIYSGGLGNVAGDQLKAASDLGVPVIGVGLLYQQGYFARSSTRTERSKPCSRTTTPGNCRSRRCGKPTASGCGWRSHCLGYSVWLCAWQAQVGRTKVYLLDSNDVANYPAHRAITSELYGGGPELRLKQELLLGIGGWRLLDALGLEPEFYDRDESGLPAAWVRRMRESMGLLTPQFSADRTVREYVERHYLPVAAEYRRRSLDKGAVGKKIVGGQRSLEEKWAALRFGDVRVETVGGQHEFEADVGLAGLEPNAVRVELYADGIADSPAVRQEMTPVREAVGGASAGWVYSAVVSAARPASHYTARVIPRCDGVALPLENPRILWQR